MSYNGSGTFNINTAGQPVVTGTTITSTAFNLLTADLASGLTTALTKDGQTTPTANIPMGTFKITGLGAGTALTDAAQFGQLQAGATQIATVTGTDTIAGTLTPTPTAYATGNLFSFVAVNTNTGAATINLNSLGAKSITKLGSTALAAGDIVSGRVYLIEYDGTRFQLINPSASSVASFNAGTTGFTPSTATTGAVTLAGTLATTNGGTGLTSFTANGVVYASSTSALTTGSALTFDGTNLSLLPSGYSVFGASSAEQMRLTSTGLGIGTSSPNGRLEVVGSTGASFNGWFRTGDATAANNAGGGFYNTSSATAASRSAVMALDADGANLGGGDYLIIQKNGNSGTADILQYSNAAIRFGTNFTNRAAIDMTLDASGNLGLGVTPSAWVGINAVQVGNLGALSSSTSAGTVLSNNAYATSAGWAAKYITTGTASFYEQIGGAHYWLQAASGTAGNAITFTQAMTLDASGNLLVGVTSAAGNANAIATSANNVYCCQFISSNAGSSPYGINISYSNSAPNGTGNAFWRATDTGAIRGSLLSNGGISNYAANNVILSDRREKINFAPSKSYIDVICAIPVQTFNYIDQNMEEDGGLTLGVVAQDVQAVAPELVSEGNWGTKDKPKMRLEIYQTDLQYALMKCIQEQQVFIELLTTRLTALEGKA